MAAPASAPEVGVVRAAAVSEAVVVDLDGLDAAVNAARHAEATTTTAAAPPSTVASTTTSTAATPVTAAAASARAVTPASTTTTVAPPTTAPAPAPASPAEAAIAHWFPDVYDGAVAVAQCESSMDPDAVSSGGGNHGLFQINFVHENDFVAVTGRPWSDVYNADANAQFARYLYDESGWSPWACSP
jgi:hypothetical protein